MVIYRQLTQDPAGTTMINERPDAAKLKADLNASA
jgi:hypothetical protein